MTTVKIYVTRPGFLSCAFNLLTIWDPIL